MKKLESNEMEVIVGGRNDSDCGWAGAKFVGSIVVAGLTGGWGAILLPFAARDVLKACELT